MSNPLQFVVVRLVLYALSLLPVPLLGALAGWGVTVHDGAITVQIEALIGAIFGALAISSSIFARWGTR